MNSKQKLQSFRSISVKPKNSRLKSFAKWGLIGLTVIGVSFSKPVFSQSIDSETKSQIWSAVCKTEPKLLPSLSIDPAILNSENSKLYPRLVLGLSYMHRFVPSLNYDSLEISFPFKKLVPKFNHFDSVPRKITPIREEHIILPFIRIEF